MCKTRWCAGNFCQVCFFFVCFLLNLFFLMWKILSLGQLVDFYYWFIVGTSCSYVNRVLCSVPSLCACICLTPCLSSFFLDLIPFSWVVHGGSLTLSNLACLVPLVLGIISRQFTVKRNIYWQSIPFTSPPDAFKVGSHSAAAFWHFVIYLFISLFGQAAGVGRIRAHGEDLSSSARLSSAAADRVLFHSLQWKRVHRDLRASIVCALRCLITFDWTPY